MILLASTRLAFSREILLGCATSCIENASIGRRRNQQRLEAEHEAEEAPESAAVSPRWRYGAWRYKEAMYLFRHQGLS